MSRSTINDPVLSHEELFASETTCVAEMLDACLRILARDAETVACSTRMVAEHCQAPGLDQCDLSSQLAAMVTELAEKVRQMRADIEPRLADVLLKDAEARRIRRGEVKPIVH